MTKKLEINALSHVGNPIKLITFECLISIKCQMLLSLSLILEASYLFYRLLRRLLFPWLYANCKAAIYISTVFGIQGGNLPVITVSVVVLATLFPKHFAYIAPAGDAIAEVLMQVTKLIPV